MNGIVVGLQARMGLVIRLPERSEDIEIQCVVDTGFEGFLTLRSEERRVGKEC